MQTLFRGNSLASKIMAYCFRFYGQNYLRELLNPHIMEMTQQKVSFEIDPARWALFWIFEVSTTLICTLMHFKLFSENNNYTTLTKIVILAYIVLEGTKQKLL